MADYGLLVEVYVDPRETAVTVAASISDDELVVSDAGDFIEATGQETSEPKYLRLNGSDLEYTGITWGVTEDDDDTILLADGLAAAADEGDSVAALSGGLPVEDWYAVVDMGEGDSVHVPLTFSQRALWAPGLYDPPVRVEVSDDHERIEDAPGRPVVATGRVAAWNLDEWESLDDDADTGRELTHSPLPNSLIVFQNGVALSKNEWERDDKVVTVAPADEVVIRTGDRFGTYYLFDPAAAIIEQPPLIEPPVPPVPANPVLIGSTTVQNSQTSIALPGAHAAGDLIVVTSSAWGSASTSDARLTGNAGIADSRMFVAWGLEDGSGDPIDVAVDDGSNNYASTTVAVYRDVDVADFALNYNGSSPGTAASYTGAYAALCVITSRNGLVAGSLSADSSGLWELDEDGEDAKVQTLVNRWESVTPDDTPPGSFALSGTFAALVCTTLLLEDA